MSSSDDSDCDGLEKVSSVTKIEESFNEVPEKTKFKIQIATGDEPDEFTYRLKKDTLLPHNTKLKGLNCSNFLFRQNRNKNPALDYNFCFSRSLKPSVKGYSGREGHGRMDGWWIFEVEGEA